MAADTESGYPKIVKDFGITVHELLRYALTGVASVALCLLSLRRDVDRGSFKYFFDSIGVPFGVLLVLAIGVAVYVVSRQSMMQITIQLARLPNCWRILGSFVPICVSVVITLAVNPSDYSYVPACLLWLIYLLSCDQDLTRQEVLANPPKESPATGQEKEKEDPNFPRIHGSELRYVKILSLNSRGDDRLWPVAEQEKLFRQHSENHLVFAISLICVTMAARVAIADLNLAVAAYFMNAAVSFWIVGFSADMNLFKREGMLLASHGKEKLAKLLLEPCTEKKEQKMSQENSGARG